MEVGANPVLQEGGGETVDGIALGGGGAALGGADMGAHLLEERLGARRQSVVAELQSADQGAMHQQVRVAPDRRGEVGVVGEREAEVTQIVGAVHCLALRDRKSTRLNSSH